MMKQKKFIPALGYDFLSEYYDAAIKITMPERRFRNRLIEWLDPQQEDQILEFGFGTGQNLIALHEKGSKAQVCGVDIDPKIKVIAEYKLKKRGIDTRLHLYDGGFLPFSDGQFDKVLSSLVFHQLDNKTKEHCLLEIRRVLRPGGILTVGDWGKARSKRMRLAFYLVQLLDGFKTTSDNVNGLMPYIIKKAGFQGVEEVDFINTGIGTFSFYTAQKPET